RPVRVRRGRTTGLHVRVVKYKAQGARISAVFNSGTREERVLPAEVLATDESRDLAVLRVKGSGGWPRPITLDEKVKPVETMQVYILGFPFGEALALRKGNPGITINKGSVSSLRENEYGQMQAVQIDGAINPGNSGGPVVDEDGNLVGARRVDRTIRDQQATGSFALSRTGTDSNFVVFQTCYVNGSGKAIYTQVISKPIQPVPVVTAPPPPTPPGRPEPAPAGGGLG